MSKYEKSIFISPTEGPIKGIPQLKAVVAARLCPGALPSYIKTYHLTGGRAKQFQRMLFDGARRKIREAERATGEEQRRLTLVIADLLNTAVLVAQVAQVGYGIPMSEEALAALKSLEMFRAAALATLMEQNNDPESFRFSGPLRAGPQSFTQSFLFD